MTPEVRDPSVLPPAQPPDPPGTRPELDLAHMVRQVRGIQQFLHEERERLKQKQKEAAR